MTEQMSAGPLSGGSKRLLGACLLLGAAVLASGIALAPERIWPNVLLVVYFLLTMGLSGAFFVALQYLTGSSWSVVLRRVPEAMTRLLLVAGLALVALLLLRPGLYPWVHQASPHEVGAGAFREAWLRLPFFRIRSLIYLAMWIIPAYALVRTSVAQDTRPDMRYEQRSARASVFFIVCFGLTFWLASYDWIMSLDPHWYSTIFGVYHFAGLFLGGLAVITILSIRLKEDGPLKRILTEEHLHDLANLMFAFSTFWMYIWFSQFLLIWYANIPEEAGYFVERVTGAWLPLFLLNIALNWVIPFFVLLLRSAKRSPSVLTKVAIVILLGRWLDLYLMIAPSYASEAPPFGIWEIGLLPAGVAAFFIVYWRALRRASLLPVGDPRLCDSLHHHQ